MSAAVTLAQRKMAVRKEMGRVLGQLTEAEVARQSAAVVAKVTRHPRYLTATSVSVYLSAGQEVLTDALLADLLARRVRCFVPRFRRGCAEMEMLLLESAQDLAALPRNAWNIRQPPDNEQRESVFAHGALDLVLAPGLAFDRAGGRLGRGKGYYDAFLARCRRDLRAHPFVLALAFDQQLVDSVPRGDLDVDVDAVVSPSFP